MTGFRSISSQLTSAHEQAMQDCAYAELRGDPALALRRHQAVPMFAQSTHGDLLALLAELGDDAPSWLISRWLTVQARRPQWTGGTERLSRRVLSTVVPMSYPHGVPFEKIGCRHPQQVPAWLWERDWVVRQVAVYDCGGLAELARHASPELLSRAEPLEEWRRADVGGYRLETSGVVVDLATHEPAAVLDLGLLEWLPPGQHVLGRMVSTSSAPGRMFEWRPLPVDELTATLVAREPHSWLRILRARARTRRLPVAFSYQAESSLLVDTPLYSWLSFLGRGMDERPDTRDQARQALEAVLTLAATDPCAAGSRRHVIAGLLLEPDLTDRHRTRYATARYADAWDTLAAVVPEPARARCLEAALLGHAAAEADPRAG